MVVIKDIEKLYEVVTNDEINNAYHMISDKFYPTTTYKNYQELTSWDIFDELDMVEIILELEKRCDIIIHDNIAEDFIKIKPIDTYNGIIYSNRENILNRL